MSQNNFPEQLIKGRIAETVFEQMFREGKNFDIYPLGYVFSKNTSNSFRNLKNNPFAKGRK